LGLGLGSGSGFGFGFGFGFLGVGRYCSGGVDRLMLTFPTCFNPVLT